MMADTPNKIEYVRLASIRAGIKLEAAGMKRRGRSCTAIAKEMFGLKRSVKRDLVLLFVQDKMDSLLVEITQENQTKERLLKEMQGDG